MIINIRKDVTIGETEVNIVCRETDARIDEIVSALKLMDDTITAKKEDAVHFIPLIEIFYFETVDNKTFAYTGNDVYETSLKIYRIEEKLQNTFFVRVSKSTILNLKTVTGIRPEKNSRLVACLANDEKIMISRQYLKNIKQKLGV